MCWTSNLPSSRVKLVQVYCSLFLIVVTAPFCIAFLLPPSSLGSNWPTTGRNSKYLVLAASSNSNPFFRSMSNFVSDAASSLFGSFDRKFPEEVEKEISSVVPYSWEDIRTQWETLATENERQFRDNLPLGYGEASPLHNLRLYDPSVDASTVRVTFYRDSASWCPYCQKVWMALEHKRIPYRVERVNMRCYGEKTSDFTKLQPNGQIPVAIIDGVAYRQSNDILAALDQSFPTSPKIAEFLSSEQKSRAKELLRLERTLFSAWMYWLTGSSQGARQEFITCLNKVEQALSGSESGFFMGGSSMSIVDIQFAPFLERMAASLIFYKGFQLRFPPNHSVNAYPNINKWFDAMEQCEAYQVTKSDYYTHCWDLPPQLGGCTYEADGERFERAINGERTLDGMQGSWELPLQPHNGGVEPDWTFITTDSARAKREAVERLSANHVNVVKFASRGAGKKGIPSVSASLSDPKAVPEESVLTSVDAVLRCVASAMLAEDPTAMDGHMKSLALLFSSFEGHGDNVIKCLSYLRDRVGVPRDMKLPAARQFRAHLNWAASHLIDVKTT